MIQTINVCDLMIYSPHRVFASSFGKQMMFSNVDSKLLAALLPIAGYIVYYRLYRQTSPAMPEKAPFQRLPKDVIPVNYDLRLQPDLKAFTFEGSEEITVKVGLFGCFTCF